MPLLTAASHEMNNHVALIEYAARPGESRLRSWSAEELDPLVVYEARFRRKSGYFGGLGFEAGCSGDGGLISPRYLGMAGPATLEGWTEALDLLFAPSDNLSAALESSSRLPGGKKLDCWVALPYPPGNQREPFGRLGDREWSFMRKPDRAGALTWWMGELHARWIAAAASHDGHRCRFQGFIWLRNALSPEDEALARAAAAEAKRLNVKLLWCHNYGSGKVLSYRELGFELIACRPTVLGIPERSFEWMEHSAVLAEKYGFGMVIWEPAGSPVRLEQWLRALRKEIPPSGFHVYELAESTLRNLRPRHPTYRRLYRYMRRRAPVLRRRRREP